MHSTRRLFFLLLCFAYLLGEAQKKPVSPFKKRYAPAQLREDALIFSNVVMAMHPAIGLYQPRIYYRRVFDSLITSLRDSMTEREFRIRLKLVTDDLHCGHTEVLYSTAYYKEAAKVKQNFSPYIFIPVKGKLYMIANVGKGPPDTLLKRGTEITKINGIPVDSMIRYAKRFITSDGYVQSAKDHYLQLGFNSYFVGLFGRPDTFVVEYSNGKKTGTAKYAAFQPKSLPALPLGPRNDSLFCKFKRASVKYRWLDTNEKTLQMKLDKFANTGYSRAYRKIFRKMRRHKSENLVLDIRNNGGGSLTNSYKLLSYLIDTTATQTLQTGIRNYPYRKYTSGNIFFKLTRFAYRIIGKQRRVDTLDNFIYTIKPKKRNHFNGKVVVLMNGGSFSASTLVAAYLRFRKNTLFIGEETGGTAEGCNAGVTPYYRLPNTGLRVRVPAFRIVHDVSPVITGQGIFPDLKTEYTLKDILQRRDLELEKAKEVLKIP
jgi:hypothetical protein